MKDKLKTRTKTLKKEGNKIMRKLFRELPFRTILIVSISLGTLMGTISTLADDGMVIEGQLFCRTNATSCSITGCRYTSNLPDSGQVCTYSGTNCPTLTQCEA